MGIFGVFKKHKDKKEIQDIPNPITEKEKEKEVKEIEIEKEYWEFSNKEERNTFIRDRCDKILESERNFEEAKMEYGQVTSYLTDIQIIDGIEGENRLKLDNSAKTISMLTNGRTDYRKRTMRISPEQYARLEKYELEMNTQLRKLKDNERYGLTIENDMRQLETEKNMLQANIKEIIAKQKFLKQLAIIVALLIVSLFGLFFVVYKIFDVGVKMPYILSILLALIVAIYIFYETRKNQADMILTERKMNRAITLLNSVKIKFINNTSALDFAYSRLGVKNSTELEYIWLQYLRAKEEEKKHREDTKHLTEYNNELISLLQDFRISDPEIWIYQTSAILDSREMEEVKHRLQLRRQNLRVKIDYNAKVKENSKKELKDLLKKMPNIKKEMTSILDDYRIKL